MSSNKEDDKNPVEVIKGQKEEDDSKRTEPLQSEKNKDKFLSQSTSSADAETRNKTSAEDEKPRRDEPYEPGVPERLASTVVREAKEQVKEQQFDHQLSPEDALEKAGETTAEGDAHLSTQAEQQKQGVGEVLHAQLPSNKKNKKKKITSAATTQSLESSPASPLGMMSPQEAHKAFKIPEPVPVATATGKKNPESTMTVAEERKLLEESLDSVPKNAKSPSVATKLPQHTMPPSQVVHNQTERRHMDEEMETSQVVQDPETAGNSDPQIVYYSYSNSTKDLKTSPTPVPVERHVARTPAASNSASAKALNRAILAEASGTPRAEDERYRGIDEEMEMERKQMSDQQANSNAMQQQTKPTKEELASLDEEAEKTTIRMPGAEKDDDDSPSLMGIPLLNHEPQRRPPSSQPTSSSSSASSKVFRPQGAQPPITTDEELEMERKQPLMSEQQQAYPNAPKELQTKSTKEELASLDEEAEKTTIRMPGAEKDDDDSPSLIGIPLLNHEPKQSSSTSSHPPASVLPPIRLQPPGAPFPPSSEESRKSLLGPAPSTSPNEPAKPFSTSSATLPANRDPGYLGFVAQETLKEAVEGSKQQLKADLNAGKEAIERAVLGGSSSPPDDDLSLLEKSKMFVEESAKDASRLVSRSSESISATETLKDSIQEGMNQVSKAVAVVVHAAQSQLDVDSLNGTPDQQVEALSGVPSPHPQQTAAAVAKESPPAHTPPASMAQQIATTSSKVASDVASKAIPAAQVAAATAQDIARVATPVVLQVAETTLTAAQDLVVNAAPVVQTTMESAADLAVRAVPVVQRAAVQTALTAQEAAQQATSVAQDVASRAGPVAAQVLHDAKESLQTASEYGKEMAGDVSAQLAEAQSKVSSVAHQAMDKAKDQAMQANAKVVDVASKTANHVQEAKEMTSFVASETVDRVKTASAAVATRAEMSALHAQDAVVGTAIQAKEAVKGVANDVAQRGQDAAASVVSKAQDKLHSVQETTSSIGQSVENTATEAVQGVKGAVESARNTAANVLEYSKESMEARKESVTSAVQNAMDMSKEMLHATAESAKETIQSAENLAGFATAIAKSKAEGVADSLKDTKDKTVAHLVEAEQFSGLVGQQVADVVSLQIDEAESSLHSAKAAITGAGHSVVDRVAASLLPGSSSGSSTGGGGDSNKSSTPALVAAMMQGASTVVDMASSSSSTSTPTTSNNKPETTKLATESWMNSAWEGIPLGPKPSLESGGEMSSIEVQAERVWNANKDKLRGYKSMPDPTTTGTEEEVAEKPWGSQLTDFSEFDVASSINRSEPDQVGQDLIDLVDKARSRLSRHFRSSSSSSTNEAKSAAATDSMLNQVPPRAMPPSQMHHQQQQGIATSAVRSVTIQSLEESKDVLVSTLSSSPSLTADSASYDSAQTYQQEHQHPDESSSIMRSAWNRAKRLIPFIGRNTTSAGSVSVPSVSVPSVDEAQGNEIGGLRKEAILGSDSALTPSDAPQGYAHMMEKRLVEIHTGSGRTPDKDMDVIPQGNEIGGIDQEQILRHIPKKVVLGEGEQKRPLQTRSKL